MTNEFDISTNLLRVDYWLDRHTQLFPILKLQHDDLQTMLSETLKKKHETNEQFSTRSKTKSTLPHLNGRHTGPTPELNTIGVRNVNRAMSLISFSDE